MSFQEILWAFLAGVLGLMAVFWTIASLFNLLHPRVTVTPWRVLVDAVFIAACSVGFAAIFLNYVR